LARQDIFSRWPAPLLSFVLEEAALRHPWGGKTVQRGQLEQLLLIGEKQNVEMQVMPTDREHNAGEGDLAARVEGVVRDALPGHTPGIASLR
jgi:hypothetical protein